MMSARAASAASSRARDRAGSGTLVDIDVLKAMLAGRAYELCLKLLPNGRAENGYWRTGNLADDPGQSLGVDLANPGQWTDYAAAARTPERSGNLLQLIALVKFGGDCKAAIPWAKSWLGLDHLDPGRLATVKAEAAARARAVDQERAEAREKTRRGAVGLFLSGAPIAGTPAEFYLRGRGIDLDRLVVYDRDGVAGAPHLPRCLSFRPDVWNVEAQRKLPCMLAAVVDVEGRQISTHRTWLAPDGPGPARTGASGWGKAGLVNPKKALGAFGGGFIPLWKGQCRRSMKDIAPDVVPHVSEGIEDGLTAAVARPELRVVAAVSLSNIGAIRFPEQVRKICILAQRDAAGSSAMGALEGAIADQQERGLDVLLAYPPVDVKDLNDVVRAA